VAIAWTVLAITSASLAALAPGTDASAPTPQAGGRIVEQTRYWALPGRAEEVFSWRLHACDVRQKLGLPRGRVLRRQGNSEDLPDVLWEVEYPDQKARDRDLKARDDSAEFREVRKHMDTLTRRFERSFWGVN
jgi:hypothetical protein